MILSIHETVYNNLLKAIQTFERRAKQAIAANNHVYFQEDHDFHSCTVTDKQASALSAIKLKSKFVAVSLLIYFSIFLFESNLNKQQLPPPVYTYNPTNSTVSSSQPSIEFNEPELKLPLNGDVDTFNIKERIAPFEIVANQDSHFFVKLADAKTNSPVITVFVHGGKAVKILVPLGTYTLKYASGEKWYGKKYLFGPHTGYSQAREPFAFETTKEGVTGYTVTLIRVKNGNLSTSAISPDVF